MVTSRLSEVEVASALERRCREGSFSERDRDRALAALDEDFEGFTAVEILPEVIARSRRLLAAHPLRAADAVQLASCLVIGELLEMDLVFAAFDERLLAAARAEGLETAPAA